VAWAGRHSGEDSGSDRNDPARLGEEHGF
jgi:hypothetical protein